MFSNVQFIRATIAYNTFDTHVPAPYIRRSFRVESAAKATLRIAVCGFYELYFNGERITRGLLSPYISNPNDMVYYDEYDLTLAEGENLLAIQLGNGFQNNPGGYIWDFEKADFRSAPQLALILSDEEGKTILESDTTFKTAPSPLVNDDYRFGETYDARLESEGWNQLGYDDAAWTCALPAPTPKGEFRLADVSPITCEQEISPVAIIKSGNGYIYDFGVNNAGVCRLRVRGEKGQKIELRHAEALKDGDIRLDNVWFVRDFWERDKDIVHLDTYTCKGEGEEIYQPYFTYHGFRYVRVDGITQEQATPELLTYLVYHTELHPKGDFACSDEVANGIVDITKRSVLSNFHHFPTDCPQREKNGWTADAALSCETAISYFDPEQNYREWMRNICKAQSERGSLPGIIPTTGWGFHWGNGPAWDCILVYLPYFTYLYRGTTDIITESAESFVAYLKYLRTRADEKGLMHIGLGDWCITDVKRPCSPQVVTDTIMTIDIATKMAHLFDAVGMTEQANFARAEAAQYRAAFRENLIDFQTMLVAGECQTSQSMALFYGIFDESEKQAAFDQLLTLIHDCDDRIDLGVLGGRVIFHVLAQFGHADLAWKMIVEVGHPSYGDLVRRGATTLWESFYPANAHWCPPSLNHHFWGDVNSWFLKSVAGIRLNPTGHDVSEVEIKPAFIQNLTHASGYHDAPAGRIEAGWRREGEEIILTVSLAKGLRGTIILPDGYRLSDGRATVPATEGACAYRVVKA